MELGYRIPIVSGVPDSKSGNPESKAQDFRFHRPKFSEFQKPDYMTAPSMQKTALKYVVLNSGTRKLCPIAINFGTM